MEKNNNQTTIQGIKAKSVKIGRSYRPNAEVEGLVEGMSIQDLDVREEYEVGDYHEPTIKIIPKTEGTPESGSKTKYEDGGTYSFPKQTNQREEILTKKNKKELENLKTSCAKGIKKSFTNRL